MPKYSDILLAYAATEHTGAGTNYLVQIATGALYSFYLNTGTAVWYRKSTDYGVTWGSPVQVGTINAGTALAVWYDKWSGLAGGLIHVAHIESTNDDIRYRTVNTESSDALSTEIVVRAGTSTAAGGSLSITRARGGNVYINGVIDAGAEGGFYRLPNANVPNGAWDAARTSPEALATLDQVILVPGFAADNQDIMAMFWDADADEVSRYIYDDSANTWAETSIATGMVDTTAANQHPHWAAAVDLTNSQIILAAWSAVDAANADLRIWKITESSITEMTNVVLNSTDDQGLAAVCIDLQTGFWWVFYGGKSDGSQIFISVNVYCKVSQDGGTTWGPETLANVIRDNMKQFITCPRWYLGHPFARYYRSASQEVIYMAVPVATPIARSFICGI
jgi:hypothetical protein